MGVKKQMNTFFASLGEQTGYRGRLVNTPMGPFRWNDVLELWENVNNGMVLNNISFMDEFAMMSYDTLGGGSDYVVATSIPYFIPLVSTTIFDYTTASLGNYFVLSRGSTYGSFVGSSGFITIPSGTDSSRFEYNSITGTLIGLLIEPTSTNILYSTNFNGIGGNAWGNTFNNQGGGNILGMGDEISVVEPAPIFVTNSPSGVKNTRANDGVAIGMGDVADSTSVYSRQLTANAGSTYYNFSMWAKAGYTLSGSLLPGNNYLRMYAGDATLANYAYAAFDLISGSLVASGFSGSGYSFIGSYVQGYTSGGTGYNWQRCSMTWQKPTATTAIRVGWAPGITYTPANQYMFGWGGQCEQVYNYTDASGNNVIPKRPTSLIKNLSPSGPSLTRPSETLLISGTSFSGFYNSSQSTISIKYIKLDPWHPRPFLVLGPTGPTSSNIAIVDYVAGNCYSNYFGVSGSTYLYNLVPAGLSTGTFNFVVGYSGTSGAMAMNSYGTTGFNIIGGTLPPVNQLVVARAGTGGGGFYLQNINYWNTVLGNNAISGVAKGLTPGNTYGT